MTVATPVRRFAAFFVATLVLLLGVPAMSGVAHASHEIVDVNPKASVNSITTVIEVIGSGFQPTPATSVTLRRDGAPTDIITGTVQLAQSTPNVLRVQFDFAHMNPGLYDVYVSQNEPLATEDKLENAFTLTASGAPSVTAVLDQTGDEPAGDITIRGTNFTRGSIVEFFVGETKDTGITFTRDDDTQNPTTISGHYTYTNAAIPGLHTVRVTHTDNSSSGQCVNCFSQPKINDLSQTALGQGASNRQVVINGAGLTGSTASISGSGVTILSQQVVPGGDQLTMQVSVASNAAATARAVTVSHPSGGYYTLANGLTITPRPTISSVSPSSLGQGALNRTLTVTGANFSNPTFAFSPASGITINSVTPVNSTTANLNVTLAEDAATGSRALIVTNGDFGTSTSSDAFTVNAGPKVTKVNPSSLNPGSVAAVTILGSNFDPTGNMTLDFGPGISANVTSVNLTGTQITASVSVSPAAGGGLRNVAVTNNADSGRGTCVGCFGINTITVQGTAASTNNQIASISVYKPAGGFTTESVPTLVRDGAVNGQGPIQGYDVTVNPAGTVLTFKANFGHAAPGPYNIQVVTGAVSDACTDCYTVTGGTPIIDSANPSTGGRGAQNLLVTLTGSNFANGDTVTVSRAGVPDANLEVVPGSVVTHSLNTLTFRLNIAPGAATGPVTITVTDTTEVSPKSGSCNDCFSIIEPPTVASVNPNTRGQGAPAINVTISGQGFEPGATVNFGPGVVTGSPQVQDNGPINNDTITVAVNIEPDAAPGQRNVTVTNTNGGTATCPSCFTVTQKPIITSISPSQGGPGQTVDVTINGSGFVNGTSVSAAPAVNVTNVVYGGPTQLTARFNIVSNPPLGLIDVRATNPDGGVGGGEQVFRIVTAPSAPSGVTATAGNASATVSWNPPSSTGGTDLTGYVVTCSPACPDDATREIDAGTTALVVDKLVNGTAYKFQVRAVNSAGQSVPSAFSNTVIPIGPDGDLIPVNPFRAMDTRNGAGPDTPVGPSGTTTVKVTGAGNGTIPLEGVTAVVANVTAVAPTGGGNLRVYPTPESGNAVPLVSTLNFSAGQGAVPNLVKVKVGKDGNVSIHNASSGSTHVLFDIVGYFVDGTDEQGHRFTATSPERLFDTRNGPAADTPLLGVSSGPNASRTYDIADGTPVPADATAVVLNVAVVSPGAGGYLTVYPAGQSRPTVSNLNFAKGQTVPNLVVVKLGTGGSDAGKLTFFNGSSGNTNVFADVVGYYKAASGSKFKPLSPVRVLDTRQTTPLAASGNRSLTVLGAGGVPNTSAVKAVVANVTVVQPTAGGYLTAYPSGENRPTASNLNFERGSIIANLVTLKVGSDGKIQLFNGSAGSTNVLVDIVGYYM